MDLVKRFVRYIKIDTEADETSTTTPSTFKQFDLAKVLVEELKELGLENVTLTDTCVVYAFLKANTDKKCDRIGFIAHLDTSPDMSGKNVRPQLLRNYKGGPITINKEKNIVLEPKKFPSLLKDIGSDLILTDGTTLLGGDDKAGIAIIMDMLDYLVHHPEIKHGDIAIAFTPDEEVGRGTETFDLTLFNCDYAYTVDGGDANDIQYENFNAASAKVSIQGQSIHPGTSKNKMINSQLVAMEFQMMLPTFKNPAYTEGYEGFNHLVNMVGSCELTTMNYIIRNHDRQLLERQKEEFLHNEDFLNKKYGEDTVKVEIEDTYSNMREYIEKCMYIVDRVKDKMRLLDMEPISSAIRGGTDGANLTYMGLPCPNLGTGARNCHGKYEYVSINEMRKLSKLLVEIAKVDE